MLDLFYPPDPSRLPKREPTVVHRVFERAGIVYEKRQFVRLDDEVVRRLRKAYKAAKHGEKGKILESFRKETGGSIANLQKVANGLTRDWI